MFCPSCGADVAERMKYCNRCGEQLTAVKKADDIELFEKRMDSEMEGLFWSIFFGLGLILGGMVLMKKVQLGEWLIIAYMILSSAAFITYFGIALWQVRRLARSIKEAKGIIDVDPNETGALDSFKVRASLEPAPSVTEHTTRTLESIPKERVTR